MKANNYTNGCLYLLVSALAFWGTVITLFLIYFKLHMAAYFQESEALTLQQNGQGGKTNSIANGMSSDKHIELKLRFNSLREYKHGKAFKIILI